MTLREDERVDILLLIFRLSHTLEILTFGNTEFRER